MLTRQTLPESLKRERLRQTCGSCSWHPVRQHQPATEALICTPAAPSGDQQSVQLHHGYLQTSYSMQTQGQDFPVQIFPVIAAQVQATWPCTITLESPSRHARIKHHRATFPRIIRTMRVKFLKARTVQGGLARMRILHALSHPAAALEGH